MIRASLEANERRRPTAAIMAMAGVSTVISTTVGLEFLGGLDGSHAQNLPEAVPKNLFARAIESNTANEDSTPTSTNSFRLRLHWQPGFMWQESPDEDWYCAACATCDPNELFGGRKNCVPQVNCMENMTLAIMKCEPSRSLDNHIARFVRLKNANPVPFDVVNDGFDGDQIQVHNSNLCVQMMNGGAAFVPLKLQQCNSTVNKQRVFGRRAVGEAMELQLFPGNGVKCMSNHHHPLNKEQIYAEDCEFSRYATNHLWCPFPGNSETVRTCDPSIVTKKPTTRRPSTVKPTSSEPITTNPTFASPSTAKPASSKPSTAKPTFASPRTAKPTSSKPITPRPTSASKMPSRKPTTRRPSTIKPTSSKPRITPKPSKMPSREPSRKPTSKRIPLMN